MSALSALIGLLLSTKVIACATSCMQVKSAIWFALNLAKCMIVSHFCETTPFAQTQFM